MGSNKFMSAKLIGGVIATLLIAGVAQADEQVLCIQSKNTLVYEADLKTIVFSGDQFESVTPFQGWGEVEKTVTIQGQRVKFVKVRFTDRQEEDEADENIGWIRESQMKMSSACEGYRDPNADENVVMSDLNKQFDNILSDDTNGTEAANSTSESIGLNDPRCCRFPLATSAQMDFRTGMRQFGWGRGGRKHAAADLYHRQFEPVYAIADGVIVRDRNLFYGETSATEIRHGGVNGFTARYGEIASSTQKPGLTLGAGTEVKAGQLIGWMKATKKKNGTYNHPMLHFELYTGKISGSLSAPVGTKFPNETWSAEYKRRKDLVNPTSYLVKWEGKR